LPNLDLATGTRRFTGLSAEDRRERRRILLLDAALDLMGTGGVEAMTVRSVLERARLNPRYFHESFTDLDELAVAVYDRVVAELGSVVWEALAGPGTEPAGTFRAVVSSIVAFVDEDRRRGTVLYAAGLGNEALNRRRAETAGMVVDFIEDYAAAGGGHHDPAGVVGRVATSILVGGFNQLLVDWLAGRIPIDRRELVDDATALFLALGDSAAARGSARPGRG
jgi:AcrR family transcriptional regulator